jgi:hypothetical protein
VARRGKGSTRAVAKGDNKAEVVKRTIEVAKKQPKAQVRIKGRSGRIQEERTYSRSSDPRRTPSLTDLQEPDQGGRLQALTWWRSTSSSTSRSSVDMAGAQRAADEVIDERQQHVTPSNRECMLIGHLEGESRFLNPSGPAAPRDRLNRPGSVTSAPPRTAGQRSRPERKRARPLILTSAEGVGAGSTTNRRPPP